LEKGWKSVGRFAAQDKKSFIRIVQAIKNFRIGEGKRMLEEVLKKLNAPMQA
jgi:hypothetical protein